MPTFEKSQPEKELTPVELLDQKGDLIIEFFKLDRELQELNRKENREPGDNERIIQLGEDFNKVSSELGGLGFGKEHSTKLRRFIDLKIRFRNPNQEDQQNFQELIDEVNNLSAELAKHGLDKDKVRELMESVV